MSDSSPSDELAAKHTTNDAQRLEGIKRWVAYIRDNPPEVWGAEQNRLVDSQLESAQASGSDPEHEARIRAFADAMTTESDESSRE